MKILDQIKSTFSGKKGRIFQPGEIRDMVISKYPGANRTSIMPADYCFNRTNKGYKLYCPYPLFISLEDGSYKYVGSKFKYDGPVFWRGTIVGKWKGGVYKILK